MGPWEDDLVERAVAKLLQAIAKLAVPVPVSVAIPVSVSIPALLVPGVSTTGGLNVVSSVASWFATTSREAHSRDHAPT